MADLSTADQNNSLATLTAYLKQFGIDTPDMTDFVRNAITNSWSDARIQLEIPNQTAFKQAFPEYQARINAGLPPMTPADILNYRTAATKMMKDAGMPAGFYDNKDDFVSLVTNDISPQELQSRIQDGYSKVQNAPQEVRDAFNQFFGAQGDSALTSFFLDPTKSTDLLSRDLTQAQISGTGKQYGFNIDQQSAQNYQQQGISAQQAQQGFQQAFQMKPLAEETISESNDLTNEQIAQGVLTGGAAEQAVKQRQAERSAQFRQAYGGAGGAVQTQQGLGTGAAR